MPTQDNFVISMPEFWRGLAFVAIGFAVALVLSWTISAAFPREAQHAIASVQGALVA